MKLFLITRIEKTETTTEFTQAMAKAEIRKTAARKAYQTRLRNEQAKDEEIQKRLMQLIGEHADTCSDVDNSVDITCIPFVSDLRFDTSYENQTTGEEVCQTLPSC